MDTVINDFVQVLRDHRVRISPAESIDAMRALEQVGLGERKVARDTLRATLIKNLDDIGTFERLFDLYFTLQETTEKPPTIPHLHDHDHGEPPSQLELGEDPEGEEQDSGGHSHDDNEPVNLRRYLGEENMSPSESIHQDPDRMRLSMLSQQLILNRKQGPLDKALERLTHQLKMRRVRGMFNPGKLAPHSGGQELPMDISAVELDHLIDHLHEMEIDEDLIRQIEEQSDDILAGLAEMIERMLERQKNLRNKELQALDPKQRSLLKLTDFSPSEQREMEGAIRRLSRQIHGAKTRRLKKDRTGRISVAHTLRQNIRYEGIPFDPVLRRHREQKPRVTLLCDSTLR